MEKLDKVIAGLECCTEERCKGCPYESEFALKCLYHCMRDALELLKEHRELKWKHKLVKDGRLELAVDAGSWRISCRGWRRSQLRMTGVSIPLSFRGRVCDGKVR